MKDEETGNVPNQEITHGTKITLNQERSPPIATKKKKSVSGAKHATLRKSRSENRVKIQHLNSRWSLGAGPQSWKGGQVEGKERQAQPCQHRDSWEFTR